MELWQQMLRQSIDSADDLVKRFNFDKETAERLNSLFHIRINPYYLNLIRYPGDPIWLQSIPDARELEEDGLPEDPLNEDGDSPVPSITHRYPDRVLFLVTSQCSMYCRFCTRKRKVSDSSKISMRYIQDGLDYIKAHPEVRDVIVSGGDPLMLTDFMLEKVLKGLREIPHVEIIRVHTKMPVVLPQRITPELCEMIKKYHPVYISTHFNHPWEATPEAKKACEMLADAGCPVGNQMVLMKGVNDDAEVVKELNRKLLMMRVKPYYIYQADMVKSTNHFRTPIRVGLEIMDKLRGHTSGLAVPYFVIDAPGGGGKIPILPQYVLYHDDEKIVLRNYKYEVFEYEEVKEDPKSVPLDADSKFLRKSPVVIRERKRRISKPKTRNNIRAKVKVEKPAEE
ncbi:MAG: KamA family radical SAM protein [Bacteroidetes bacterium]|nr:KamA family radical SAM protein [Bacteroidota bacterium]MCL5738921.1 KamA family radical SAM protein [Bacteroidota bacterium]